MNTNKNFKPSFKKNIFNEIYNNVLFDEKAIQFINTQNWDNVEVTKYHIDSKHLCLFNDNNEWVVDILFEYDKCTDVLQKENDQKRYEYDINLLSNAFSELNIDLELVDKKYIYHFLLFNNLYKQIGHSKSISRINLLWVNDNNQNIINENLICDEIKKVHLEKKIHFSCLDELLTSLEIMNNNDIINKNIIYGGYCVKVISDNKYIFCILRTDIYINIINILPNHENKYIKFLELYQFNKLNDVIPFLHKYPSDVVRRINMSIKTISKEILNIYHLTRRQQNPELYNSLPSNYKELIYNLHKIYVTEKCDEYMTVPIDKTNFETELEYRKKKSVSVDIVYNYLKNMKNHDLLKIFEYRKILIDTLHNINYDYSHIFYIDNIDLTVQLELMFGH